MHQIEMFIHAFAGLAVCRALLGSQAPGLSIDLCLYPTRPIAYTLQPTTYNLQPTIYNLHPTPHNHQPLHTIFLLLRSVGCGKGFNDFQLKSIRVDEQYLLVSMCLVSCQWVLLSVCGCVSGRVSVCACLVQTSGGNRREKACER